MTVESATYISDLNASLPDGADQKGEGDNHIRLVKTVVKATFPNIDGAITATDTELNYVAGVTSALQTQLAAKAPLASPTFTGTVTAAAVTATGAVDLTAATATAATQAAGTNGTTIATTEFVQAAVASASGGATRGEMFFYGSF